MVQLSYYRYLKEMKYTRVSQRDSVDEGGGRVVRMQDGHERCGGSIGLIFMALSAISFSLMSFVLHTLAAKRSIPSFEQVAFRSTTGVILCVLWIRRSTDESLRTVPKERETKCILFARCIIGVIAMSSNWFVFTQLPLGEATVIVFTAPIFTSLIARIYLKEHISSIQAILMGLSTFGVTLVARPRFLGFSGDSPPEYATASREIVFLIGIFGAVLSGITNVLVRTLVEVHSVVVVLWLMIAALVVSIPMSFGTQNPIVPNGTWVWIGLLAIGCLGFAGQVFKTQGLKWEKAGIGSMMRNMDIVFSFGLGTLFLGEEIHSLSVFGACVVLIASISIGIIKIRSKTSETTQKSVAIPSHNSSGAKKDSPGESDIELRRFELLENPFGFSKNFAEMSIE